MAWLLLAAGGIGQVVSAAQQPGRDEFRLKAAFLYRFPQFVEWPPEALEGKPTLDLCLVNPHPFGKALDELVQGESLAGRPLAVRHVAPGEVDGCQLLFVSGEPTTRRAVLKTVHATPVLTVSDAPHFLNEGGIVQLRLVDQRVRFDIDAGAASQAGLRLSAQLLRLAATVRGGAS